MKGKKEKKEIVPEETVNNEDIDDSEVWENLPPDVKKVMEKRD